MNKMWEPTFDDWSEDKVSMSSCEVSTHGTSRNEYGVMMQVGDDEEPHPENAAIFWTDQQHLYLRYDWDQWYKISNDDKDNCANICKRNTATLMLCTMSSIKYHAVRVYHIDKLPEELFGRQTDDAPNSDKATQLDLDLEDSPPTAISVGDDEESPASLPNVPDPANGDSDEEKESEKQVEAFAGQPMPFDLEIQAAVDAEIEKFGGRAWLRFRPGNNSLYSFDFVQIGAKFYTIVYADFDGDWLADEEAFAEEPPLWFSEKAHRVSPVFQAMKCRTFFAQELPRIKIDPIVALPEKCIVLNDEEMQRCWRETCGTAVVRTKRIDESNLDTLHDHLAAQPAEDIKVPELDVVELVEISDRFTMDPENWINKD